MNGNQIGTDKTITIILNGSLWQSISTGGNITNVTMPFLSAE